MRISCIQMDIAFGDPDVNYRRAETLIRAAIADHPDVLVLPELWTTGYDLGRLPEIADLHCADTRAFLSAMALAHNVHIVGGSVAVKTAAGITNTMLVYNRQGQPTGEYSKPHLFRPMEEHRHLIPGDQPGLFTLDGISCAGVICYDIRFPEWTRKHAVLGAEVLFVSAEWPLEREAHWRALLAARAIENQCYVAACNRSGSDPSCAFAGRSMIIGPWGDTLAEAGESEEIITAEIDLSRVHAIRRDIPILADRRPDLYRE